MTPAIPVQLSHGPRENGNRRSCETPTASNEPSANSQARVSGEKNAHDGSVPVWITDHANEAMTMTARAAARVAASHTQGATVAPRGEMSGQPRYNCA